jgi:hypothetical protein
MARADYFDRAIQAAFHVLGNLNQQSFLEKIDNCRVAVAFDCNVAAAEGDASVDLVVRLLARFYPKLAILPLDPVAEAVVPKFKALARAINPKIAITERALGIREAIVVGKTPLIIRGVSPIYIGSHGWIAGLSCKEPIGSMVSNNPFGAGIAACLGAANIFRHIFTNVPLDDEIRISALDLDPQASEPVNFGDGKIDLGEVFLVGAGAIGNGFLWGISRYTELKGRLHVIDHDNVDLSNLQRYILTERKDNGLPKSKKAADVFAHHPGIHVNSIAEKWEEFLDSMPSDQWLFNRVVSALDTPRDRINLQASLPRWVVNAWTGTGDIGVSHHDFTEHACLACLYMPTKEALNEDQLIAQAFGFSQDQTTLLEIRTKIETAWLIERSFLERISVAKEVPIEKLLPFEGQLIRSLYSQGVCSGAVMELANGPSIQRAEVPMPFQSALAGILEAAVLVAHAGGLIQVPRMTRINLMKPFPKTRGFSWNPAKHARCFCNDDEYKDRFSEKYMSLA